MTIRSFATMGSLTLLAAASMYGQQLKLDIPFEFQIGEKVLPAGHYEVKRAYDNTPDRLTFTCWENKTHQTFFFPRRLETKPGDPGSVLVFNRYGDKYFLAKVVMSLIFSSIVFGAILGSPPAESTWAVRHAPDASPHLPRLVLARLGLEEVGQRGFAVIDMTGGADNVHAWGCLLRIRMPLWRNSRTT